MRMGETKGRLPITILMGVRDEEPNLRDCLHSVRGWVEKIVVIVDPRTLDRTREIAAEFGATVVEHAFEDCVERQRTWALAQPGLVTERWTFFLDADERVSPEMRKEIEAIVRSTTPAVAYAIRFRFIFYGKWMRCWQSAWMIRFFQTGRAWYEHSVVHEPMTVDGPIGYIRAGLVHNDFKNMDAWIDKHNRYATLESAEMLRLKRSGQRGGSPFGNAVERRKFLKRQVWNRLPARPVAYFLYYFVLKGGFRDGALGFRFCLMRAIFDALVMAKLWESEYVQSHPPGNYYRGLLAEHLARHPEDAALYP